MKKSLLLGSLLFSVSLFAAEIRVIEPEVVDLRQGPGQKSPIVGKLKRGAWVAAANRPVEGYYKLRTERGQLGWVKSDSLAKATEGFVMKANGNGAPALYAARNIRSAVRAPLSDGMTLWILPVAVENFYSARMDSGETGWVFARNIFVGHTAQVTGPDFNVRIHGSRGAKVDFTVSKGDWVYSSKGSSSYYQIRTDDGRMGWLPAQSLRFGDRPGSTGAGGAPMPVDDSSTSNSNGSPSKSGTSDSKSGGDVTPPPPPPEME